MGLLSFFAQKIKLTLLKILYHKYNNGKIATGNTVFMWRDYQFSKDKEVIFTHGGGLGDILFSLYFCKELAEHCKQTPFHYHILTNTYDQATKKGYNRGVSREVANFLKPLLEKQSYIKQITCDAPPSGNIIKLNHFRKLKINFSSSDIRSWYYSLTQVHLPREFWKPVIEADVDSRYQDKILICYTGRYCNVHIDCRYLETFKGNMVFIGTPAEHEDFCKNVFPLPYQPCKDMLEMAQFMAGAKGFIGNQSGIYSLAECMKIPRILLAPAFVDFHGVIIPGPHNNHPIGGWCEDVISTEKMIAAVNALLAKE